MAANRIEDECKSNCKWIIPTIHFKFKNCNGRGMQGHALRCCGLHQYVKNKIQHFSVNKSNENCHEGQTARSHTNNPMIRTRMWIAFKFPNGKKSHLESVLKCFWTRIDTRTSLQFNCSTTGNKKWSWKVEKNPNYSHW